MPLIYLRDGVAFVHVEPALHHHAGLAVQEPKHQSTSMTWHCMQNRTENEWGDAFIEYIPMSTHYEPTHCAQHVRTKLSQRRHYYLCFQKAEVWWRQKEINHKPINRYVSTS